ncbi:TadA family conjugal transfer-associated ATPase [Kitasatospora albolonga]
MTDRQSESQWPGEAAAGRSRPPGGEGRGLGAGPVRRPLIGRQRTGPGDGFPGGGPRSGAGGPSAPRRPTDDRAAALIDAVRIRLAEAGAAPTAGSVAAALRAARPPLGGDDVLDAVRVLRSELVGAGPLDGLLGEPEVTDVLVNGPDEVWVDRGAGLRRVPEVRFTDAEAVRRLAHRLATAAGRRLDDARPWVDARLPDGTRLHAVLPPIAAGCTHISLRICRTRPFTLDELVAGGALAPAGAELLRAVLRARLSLLISGGTGTGKTTLLAALLGLVGPEERIVLAEDSAELSPDHPHVVRLQSRPPNQEGLGELTLKDLVRQALRMRPDRVVVGEVRGEEVVDLLSALNTGHEGGCGTVHANTATDVPARLEALGSQAGLDRLSLHSQLRAALDVVIHLVRDQRTGRRRVAELHMLVGDERGLAVTVPAVTFTAQGEVLPGPGWERLRRRCAERGVGLPDPAVLPDGAAAGAGAADATRVRAEAVDATPGSAEVAR